MNKNLLSAESLKAGDHIFFGKFDQDDDDFNDKEPIEWIVLEVKDGKAFAVSKYALLCKAYDTPGPRPEFQPLVRENGKIEFAGLPRIWSDVPIRPALWIDLSYFKF